MDQFSVTLGSKAPCAGKPQDHGHTLPILNEIRHALERLIATGEETRIDLNAMPFGPGDLDHLRAFLGTGEVQASVSAMGPTLVQETAIPGVWLVDYQNADSQRLTLHLEIAPVPEILRPQPQDLAQSIAMLDARMDEGQSNSPRSP